MKKKLLGILLSLCMLLTMMPIATGMVWAATGNEKAVDSVIFGYAYDVQRNPAYPTRGTTVTLRSLTRPIIDSDRNYGNSEGSWRLTKAGTYQYMVRSKNATKNLEEIVTGISSKYDPKLDEDKIAVYELKNGNNHVAYGVIVAYAYNDNSGYDALFQGDTLDESGAGYYFSTEKKNTSQNYVVEANFDITSFMNAKSISLSSRELTFNAEANYTSVPAQTVTITNTGNDDTGVLTVTKSGEHADYFTVEELGETNNNIAVGGTMSFNVKPKDKLPVGNHTATIIISDEEDTIREELNISFTVAKKEEVAETKSISVSPEEVHFADATAGYTPVGVEVTIKNDGKVDIKDLTVTKSDKFAEHFTVKGLENTIDSIAVGEEKSFEVKPVDALSAGNYTATITISDGNEITENLNISFTVKAASSGGSYYPTIQKPTIITDEGGEATLSYYGDRLTIKAKDGYEMAEVLLNGVSKGKATELTGLKTGDKVEVKTTKKQGEVKEPTKEETIAALGSRKLIAKSKLITLKNGKKAIRVTWYDKAGAALNFDGVEVYRSSKKAGFGKKPFYVTKADKSEGYYLNTKDLKAKKTYYYKVRGYVEIDEQRYYTAYSTLAYRTVK